MVAEIGKTYKSHVSNLVHVYSSTSLGLGSDYINQALALQAMRVFRIAKLYFVMKTKWKSMIEIKKTYICGTRR